MAIPERLPVRPEMVRGLAQMIAEYMNENMAETKEQVTKLTGRVDGIEKRMAEEGLRRSQKRMVQREVGEKAHHFAKAFGVKPREHYEAIYGSLKDHYDVGSYEELPRSKFEEIVQLIKKYDGSGRFWWRD